MKTGKHAADIASYADGVIVGSALIQAASDGNLGELAAELARGVRA